MKAFSRILRSEDYGGLLRGVNGRVDDETKVKREPPTQHGTLALYGVHAGHSVNIPRSVGY